MLKGSKDSNKLIERNTNKLKWMKDDNIYNIRPKYIESVYWNRIILFEKFPININKRLNLYDR